MKRSNRFLSTAVAVFLMFIFMSCAAFADDLGNNEPKQLTCAFLYNTRPVLNAPIRVSVCEYKLHYNLISESDPGVSYQWYRNNIESNIGGTAIENAEQQSYIPTEDDLGCYLYCRVYADGINYVGDFTTLPSNDPVAASAELGGAVIKERNISAHEDDVENEFVGYIVEYGTENLEYRCVYDPDPIDAALYGDEIADYQWYRNTEQSNTGGELIDGADSYTYRPCAEDRGCYIYFTATGKGNYRGTVTSDAVSSELSGPFGEAAVAWCYPANIRGIAVKGAVLQLDLFHIAPCQWYRNDVPENTGGEPILGANSYKYAVTDDDVGKYLYADYPNKRAEGNGKRYVTNVTEMVKDNKARIETVSLEPSDTELCGGDRIAVRLSPENAVASVQWYRNDKPENAGGDPIYGATYCEYTVKNADIGKYIYCVCTPADPFVGEPTASEVTDKISYYVNITYDPNGGEIFFGDSVRVSAGNPIGGDLYDGFFVTRENYEFLGWADSANAKAPNVDENTIAEKDMTLYAVWKRIDGSAAVGGAVINSAFTTEASAETPFPEPTASSEPFASSEPTAAPEPSVTPGASTETEHIQVFDDVPDDHWAFEPIMELYKRKIINGESEKRFMPDDPITRAEFAKIAVCAFDIPLDSIADNFSDVGPGDWCAPYAAAAKKFGLIKGVTESRFAPDDTLTREQAAAIIGRYFEASAAENLPYADGAEIEPYAVPYVSALTEMGIIEGADGYFDPKSDISRAEACKLIYKSVRYR